MSLNVEELLKQANDGYEEAAKANTFQEDPRILKLKKNATYTGRFVINAKDPGHSRVPYNELMFNSPVDQTFVYAGRDPNDLKVKDDLWTKTKWDEHAKAKAEGTDKAPNARYKLLNPKRKELINFYLHKVEGDAEAAKKIGTVVVLKYPAQMSFDKKEQKNVYRSDILIKIEQGLSGNKKDKIGPKKPWDLSKAGRSFTVAVTEKDKFANYSQSEFDDAEDLGLTKEQISDIMLNQTHNLLEFVPKMLSQEELKALLDTKYFGTSANNEDDIPDTDVDDDDDIIPGLGGSLPPLGPKPDVDDDDLNLNDL